MLILNKMFIFGFLLFVMLSPLLINLKKSYINKILQICHTETTNIHALRPNSFFVCFLNLSHTLFIGVLYIFFLPLF